MADNEVFVDETVVESPEVREQQARDAAGRYVASEVQEVEDEPQSPDTAPEKTTTQTEAAPVTEPEQPAEELEEIEFDGKKYTVPKPLKGGFLMQADYTRKTQEVADQRREIEQARQQIAQRAKVDQEDMAREVAMHALDYQIKQFEGLNWDQFVTDNPTEANRQWMQFQSLKDKRSGIQQEYQQRQSERQQESEREARQRIEATQEYAKKLPGWSPEMDLRIINFAKSTGTRLGIEVSDAEIASSLNPMVYEILRLAEIGEQTMKRQTASAKPTPAQTKPTSTVGGRANPSAGKTLADMDMDEYVAARQKQMAASG